MNSVGKELYQWFEYFCDYLHIEVGIVHKHETSECAEILGYELDEVFMFLFLAPENGYFGTEHYYHQLLDYSEYLFWRDQFQECDLGANFDQLINKLHNPQIIDILTRR